MFHSLPPFGLALLCGVVAAAASAQPAPALKPPPALPGYQSAFENYQPFADDKPIGWREANETVYRRGGWQAYAKEAASAGDATGAAHSGHSMPMPAMPGMPLQKAMP